MYGQYVYCDIASVSRVVGRLQIYMGSLIRASENGIKVKSVQSARNARLWMFDIFVDHVDVEGGRE